MRRRPLLEEALKEASDLSTDGMESARRKAGIVFERMKEGREEVGVTVVDIASGGCDGAGGNEVSRIV